MAETPNYAEQLKTLRQNHPPAPELMAEVKEQNKAKAAILAAIAAEAKTVPQIAKETGLDAAVVLWFMAGLKKYGFVTDEGKKGSYYTYKKKVA